LPFVLCVSQKTLLIFSLFFYEVFSDTNSLSLSYCAEFFSYQQDRPIIITIIMGQSVSTCCEGITTLNHLKNAIVLVVDEDQEHGQNDNRMIWKQPTTNSASTSKNIILIQTTRSFETDATDAMSEMTDGEQHYQDFPAMPEMTDGGQQYQDFPFEDHEC
jgi:hypothetical protein